MNPVPEPLGPVARIAGADAFVRATGARIEHGATGLLPALHR